jgi:hypothetical protein
MSNPVFKNQTQSDLYLNFARFDCDLKCDPGTREFHIPGLERIDGTGRHPGAVITYTLVAALWNSLSEKEQKTAQKDVARYLQNQVAQN